MKYYVRNWLCKLDPLSRQFIQLAKCYQTVVRLGMYSGPSVQCKGFGRMKHMKDCPFSFIPTRTSCIPCYCKLDTESVAQPFLSYKERVEMRNAAEDRNNYNQAVWERIVDMRVVSKNYIIWALRFTMRFPLTA